MEHLDLAGVISSWSLPAFEQQDAIYLSSSRQMLEPILEETSEDEECAQNSWNQYETGSYFCSSTESETGSVIRIEVNKDADSISERDFACPAKRARRSDEFLIGGPTANNSTPLTSSVDDAVLLRRSKRPLDYEATNSLERFLAFEANASRDSYGSSSQQRSSTGSRRFDDFYSDSDSLSYQSLSRSSSLIQFESLERQLVLQEQHSSMNSLGNSSPSLLSFDGAGDNGAANSGSNGAMAGIGGGSCRSSASNSGNNSRRGSQSSLLMTKRFESADGRLHQTYFDLDKLNFDDEDRSARALLRGSSSSGAIGISNASLMKPSNLESTAVEIKSDSESSTSSSSSSGNSIMLSVSTKSPRGDSKEAKTSRVAAFQRGGKNSAENLSEDSGYCEPSTLRRSKSKSIPKNFEKFCEEEEEYVTRRPDTAATAPTTALNEDNKREEELDEEIVVVVADENIHSKNSNTSRHYDDDDDDDDDVDEVFEDVYDEDGSAEDDADHIDICRPKINNGVVRSMPETRRGAAPPLYDLVKNSPARESCSPTSRLMAHSPSPVSSEGSSSASCRTARSTVSSTSTSTSTSTTPSTCASAASFTWHTPTHGQQPTAASVRRAIEIEIEFGEHEIGNSESLGDVRPHLRNSLPDIRDAFRSSIHEPDTFLFSRQPREVKIGGLESSSSASQRPAKLTPQTLPLTSCDAVDCSRLGGGGGGHQRAASVPSELNKVGKKRRSIKSKYSRKALSDNDDELSDSPISSGEDDFVGIQRSCSWSERRERTLQRQLLDREPTTAAKRYSAIDERESVASSFLGYSYCDLTRLDYSGRKPVLGETPPSNYKRCGIMSESRKSSGDYESFICKGNFLLDELSEIYDKNASILNDRSVDEEDPIEVDPKRVAGKFEPNELESQVNTVVKALGPLPPPRQSKPSSFTNLENEVQHVQLTIRKPPTRQRHRRENAPNSLIQESVSVAPFSTFGKTFDQDPTLIRTSYAQSLEKCNFDAKEISHTNLSKCGVSANIPKRRFHSQATTAKKRNLVSSTPNLNAYDPRADEIDDDMYVSSAHTSMHTLPQTQAAKPLGILLPTGSRSSIGKEVSFCPVVSKYCWQEQSSEECNEPPTPSDTVNDGGDEADSDDELLDNADATVIYNTKENEMIAARYNAEQEAKHQQEKMPATAAPAQQENAIVREHELQQVEKVRALLIVREPLATSAESEKTSHSDTPVAESVRRNVMVVVKTSLPQTAESLAQPALSSAVSPESSGSGTHSRQIAATSCTNSDGSVNGSVNQYEQSPSPSNGNSSKVRPLSIQLPILSEPPTNRAHHILYASQQMLDNFERRRDYYPDEYRKSANSLNSANMSENPNVTGATASPALINNNNEKMKSKFKADEKHPNSKGFLSRLGFRFSLRRNKKKQQQMQQQQQQQQQQPPQQTEQTKVEKPSKGSKASPVANGKDKKTSSAKAKTPDYIYIPLKGPLPENNNDSSGLAVEDSSNASTASVHSAAATTKVVTGKPPLPKQPPRQQQQQYQQQSNATHAQYEQHPQMNTSATATPNSTQLYTTDFLESERSYYMYDDFRNQLTAGMHANGVVGANHGAAVAGAVTTDKRHNHNNNNNNNNKIGLIETNLDTHETIITGKTRSLMNIGPQQLAIAGGHAVGKHSTLNADGTSHHNHCDDEEDAVSDVRVKQSAQAGGAQIASVRRPHKSMEFLLDKENQKNVLPPENELQKSHDQNPAALSEHQLRVQASLQRLNIPDWFRQYNQNTARSPDSGISGYKPGNFTRKRATESGRWAGLNSKTTSLSSLGSQRSDRSPLLLSPSAHSHHGGQSSGVPHSGGPAVAGSTSHGGGHGAFSRWSTSHLNSSQTSPSVSQRGTFIRGGPVNSSFMSVASGTSSVIRNSYRQPYLGWRSTEKLSQRTPHERLASSLLQQQRTSPTQGPGVNGVDKLQAVTPEIQSSIKEVTSAIVHYVNDQTNQQRSRSTSPNSR